MTPETAYVVVAIILGFFFATATAKAARKKGANATLWFVVGLLLPGLGLIIALFLEEQWTKECPRCVHRIDLHALVCGYCGHEFIRDGSHLQNRLSGRLPNHNLDRPTEIQKLC